MSYRVSGEGVVHLPSSQWFTKNDKDHWEVYERWVEAGGVTENMTSPEQSLMNALRLRRDLYREICDGLIVEATIAAHCGDHDKHKLLMDRAVLERKRIKEMCPLPEELREARLN